MATKPLTEAYVRYLILDAVSRETIQRGITDDEHTRAIADLKARVATLESTVRTHDRYFVELVDALAPIFAYFRSARSLRIPRDFRLRRPVRLVKKRRR